MAKGNRPRKIPFRARRLVREVLSGKHKSISAAGKAAGYAHGSSGYAAMTNLQGTISEIMDQAGLSDQMLVEKSLLPLLNATQKKVFQHNGKIKYSKPLEDNDIRLRALDVALRIKGKYAPLAVEQAHKHAVQVLILDVPRPKRDNPPPTKIELAKPVQANGNGHANGNGSNGNGHKD